MSNMATSNRDCRWWNQCCRYQHQTGRSSEESRCHTGPPTQLRSPREKCVQKLVLPHSNSSTHTTINQRGMCKWYCMCDYQHSPWLLQLSSDRHNSTKHSRLWAVTGDVHGLCLRVIHMGTFSDLPSALGCIIHHLSTRPERSARQHG